MAVKERRLVVSDHRFGKGKVHRLIYSRLNKMWYPACRRPGAMFFGIECDDLSIEVTCQRCEAPGAGARL